MFNRQHLFSQLLQMLQSDLERISEAADNAKLQATHSESKAETRYDTLGLEQAYLAHGQSMRAHALHTEISELKQLIQQFIKLPSFPVSDSTNDPIRIGSIVTIQQESAATSEQNPTQSTDTQRTLWILTQCAGKIINDKKTNITVISPKTPMASLLIGKYIDDEIMLASISDKTNPFVITAID